MLELPSAFHSARRVGVLTHRSQPSTVTYQAKLSTFPYTCKPGLIARLLGVALEAMSAYGVRLLRK